MRAISFGKLVVQNAGVPVKMGQSTLSANMTAADETLSVTSATPFCADMIPFKMDIDPTGSLETVVVKGISGSTFTIQRGMEGTTAVAHGSGAVVMAKFPFAGWDVGVVAGQTGKTYWGTKNINVGTRAGVIKEFWPNPSGAVQVTADQLQFLPSDGNPLFLADYGMDVAVSGEGMHVTIWER